MFARFVPIAAALVVSTSAFAADAPTKAPVQPAAQQPPQRPGPVMLASADDMRAPAATDEQAPTPPKHRVARVTTCRCGDVAGQAQPEQ
jgi:hypothetical protein